MDGVRSLINATGAPLVCPDVSVFPKSFYPSGDLPIDLDFNENKNQLDALAEADIMSSELTYVIVKPCGLTMAVGAQKGLTVGHDDNMTVMPDSIARADVASLCGEALSRTSLRFDVCSEVGTPTSDYSKMLDEARSDGDSCFSLKPGRVRSLPFL